VSGIGGPGGKGGKKYKGYEFEFTAKTEGFGEVGVKNLKMPAGNDGF
jgi:hypothetical protein